MIIDPRVHFGTEKLAFLYIPEYSCHRECSSKSGKCCLICDHKQFGCEGPSSEEFCQLEPEECGYSLALTSDWNDDQEH